MWNSAMFALLLPGLLFAQSPPEPALEVEGFITSVDGETLTLLDGLVAVNASGARLEVDDHESTPALSDLQPGVFVSVEGDPGPDGLIHATVIEVEDEDPETEIEGVIDGIDGDRFSIGGIWIERNGGTKLEGNRLIAVGQRVEVELKVAAGSLIAVEIELDE